VCGCPLNGAESLISSNHKAYLYRGSAPGHRMNKIYLRSEV